MINIMIQVIEDIHAEFFNGYFFPCKIVALMMAKSTPVPGAPVVIKGDVYPPQLWEQVLVNPDIFYFRKIPVLVNPPPGI
jgi:hypothetical protein